MKAVNPLLKARHAPQTRCLHLPAVGKYLLLPVLVDRTDNPSPHSPD